MRSLRPNFVYVSTQHAICSSFCPPLFFVRFLNKSVMEEYLVGAEISSTPCPTTTSAPTTTTGKRIEPIPAQHLRTFLEDVVKTAVTHSAANERKTVTAFDVVMALKKQGKTLYGFGADSSHDGVRSTPPKASTGANSTSSEKVVKRETKPSNRRVRRSWPPRYPLSKASINRLAARAGVKRLSSLLARDLNEIAKEVLKSTLRAAIALSEHEKKRRITVEHIVRAFQVAGVQLFGYPYA
jgi:histone H3/H4